MVLSKRKPTRLKEYDYSQNGYYFITICTHKRKNTLSNINVGEGFPLPYGVKCYWMDKIQCNETNQYNERYKRQRGFPTLVSRPYNTG